MCRSRRAAGFLTLVLALAGCGGQAGEDQEVRARNLKTGAVEAFGSAGDVPDGYILCESLDCPVPPSVPCEGLGAMVCQMHPECKVKVLSCTDGDTTVYFPGELGSGSDGAPRTEPAPSTGTELCEVTCVPDGQLACEQIGDPLTCQARPECEWGDVICADCACVEGMPCDCGVGCIAGCFTRPFQICEDLRDEQQCASRPECEWLVMAPCVCGCSSDEPTCTCDCPTDEAGMCVSRPQANCEELDLHKCLASLECEWLDGVACSCACSSDEANCACDCPPHPQGQCVARSMPDCFSLGEKECLSRSECEWGQFYCPMCAIEEPSGDGAPAPCDCPPSCRAATNICPPVAMPAIGCADGSQLEPIYDFMGCVIGWRCAEPSLYCGGSAGLQCPQGFRCELNYSYPDAMGQCVPEGCLGIMCEMFCEHGFKVDPNGCEICECNEAPACKRTGCSGQICSDKDIYTTCEYMDYYKCYDLAQCGLTSTGRCGWIPNDAFDKCMASSM